ncbi:MAG TPA: glycerol-3-phosphate dehydrogenase C-terminal domain-containing protein, partial [Allosphingosinicella sp.]|nr:glycerol-3-phosphate dehydrogenase C-terminal domain-containing protein [Allosphingosinicella sp.]
TGWMMLPGGDLYPAYVDWLRTLTEWMPLPVVDRMSKAYGTRLKDLLGTAGSLAALGRHFGAGLYEAEVRWLVEREFARTAEDVLWRRTKLGLRFTPAQAKALETWLSGRR